MGVLVEVNIIIFCFGTAASYIVAVRDIFPAIMPLLDLPSWLTPTIGTILFWAMVMLPASMFEKMGSISWSGTFGVFAIFYLAFAVVFLYMTTVASKEFHGTDVRLCHVALDAVTSLPIIMFSFTCQFNVFSVQEELEHPTKARMLRLTKYSVFSCFAAYICIGVFGYLNFLDATKGNLLGNFNLENLFESSETLFSDIIIGFAYIVITITVVMAFPLNIYPCRYTLEYLFFSKEHQVTEVERMFLSACICGATLGIALLVPSLNVLFQLLGGTASAFVCFVLPAAFAIKLQLARNMRPAKRLRFNVAVWTLFIGGIVAGVGSTVYTIVALIHPQG